MNELEYNDIVKLVSSINGFRHLVQVESKRPIAVRLLMTVYNYDKRTAWEFVSEYYDRMDVKFGSKKEIKNMFKMI